MANAFWPTAVVDEAESVGSVSSSAYHSSRPKAVTPGQKALLWWIVLKQIKLNYKAYNGLVFHLSPHRDSLLCHDGMTCHDMRHNIFCMNHWRLTMSISCDGASFSFVLVEDLNNWVSSLEMFFLPPDRQAPRNTFLDPAINVVLFIIPVRVLATLSSVFLD